MFEKRLRGYRAIGYEQATVPTGYEGARDEPVVERDDEAFLRFDDYT